jgi:hypothetical protein
MKHLTEEDLILLYYGEPGGYDKVATPDDARAHLGACRECRLRAESLAATLNLCSEWKVAEPDAQFERGVWARLAPHIADRASASWWQLPKNLGFPASVWAAGAAMAALLIIAFIAGRTTTHRAGPSITAGLSSQARERILEISLADHLDRAGMILTEISNVSYSGAEDFLPERARAQDLVDEGRLMRQLLAIHGESATLAFLDEVERFMLEVANSPDSIDRREIEGLQRRIGADSLLFKVRIIESNLRTEGQKS